ncbi:MAG: hypothetical protein J6T04_10080 [Bacteroidales bacterium]|nr:hypothetical protein [Bacteroidales bacterium]
MRDERCEEGEEVISRKTIEDSIDGENAAASTSWSSGTSASMALPSLILKKATGVWMTRCSCSGRK